LLKKLSPFLETLSQNELSEIPIAAQAKPERRRWFRQPEPAQPVEIVMVKGDKQVVGAVLLRRKWMEEIFAAQYTEGFQQKPEFADVVANALEAWLYQLSGEIGSLLTRQAEFWPLGVYEDPASVLDFLHRWSSEQISEALEVPLILSVIQHFIRKGTPDERRRVKEILHAWAPEGRGAPTKQLGELADVVVARAVKRAETRLAEGHRLRATLYKPNTYNSSGSLVRELRRKGYREDEIEAIVNCKRLNGAAQWLVAHQRLIASQKAVIPHIKREIASVRAMASRGRARMRTVR
jgi:hypothetical protein